MQIGYDETVKRNSGQVAVFVLLVMLLGLTIGLSVTSRTIQNLKQTSTTDQSSRAFTAAEAGVEDALQQGLRNLVGQQKNLTLPNNISVNYVVSNNATNSYVPSQPVAKDDVVGINLTGFSGNVTVYWNRVAGENAALEFSLYSQDAGGNYAVQKWAFDPSNRGNNFAGASGGGATGYSNSAVIPVPSGLQKALLRIRTYYTQASIRVDGTGLPAQTYTVTSTAKTNSGNVARAVQVTQSAGTLPSIFDYVLFSAGAISQ